MHNKKIALGLGLFSVALGAFELLASGRIARALGPGAPPALVKGFGAREIVAGAGLLAAPAHGAAVWNRVGGDAMDLAALAVAAKRAPANKIVWGAIAFVVAATAIDILTALRLDDQTGKTFPVRGELA
jgi:hypothetical protein